MKINKLKLKNFRLFRGDYEFDFGNKQLIIIEGQNGNGKSTIFDAIEWCITGELRRYKGSREPSKFNFLLNHEANLLDTAEMFVELEFVNDNDQKYSIKRSILKTNSKPRGETNLTINEEDYSVKEGNEKIFELISNQISNEFVNETEEIEVQENTGVNLKNMIDFFSATQILSQDELSDFVLAKKPQDRFATLERILGLDKYGENFRNYLKIEGQDKFNELLKQIHFKKENLINKKRNTEQELYEISTQIKSINSRYQINEGLEEIDIINQASQIINNITNISFDNHNRKVDKKLQTTINNMRKKIIRKIEKEQKKRNFIESNKSIFTVPRSDILKQKIEHEEMLMQLAQKIRVRNRALNKYKNYEKRFNWFKDIRRDYIRERNEYENFGKEINDLRKRVENYYANHLINEINGFFTNITDFKARYEAETKSQKTINICLKIKQLIEDIKNNKNIIDKLNKEIFTLDSTVQQKEREFELLSIKAEQVNKKMEDHQTSFINQMVYDVQDYLVSRVNDEKECPVCGHLYEPNDSLVKAIKEKMKVNNSKLNKLEITKVHITNQVNQLASDLYKVKEDLKSKNAQKEKLQEKNNLLLGEKERLSIEISNEWLEKDFENLSVIEANNTKFLNDFHLHYQVVITLVEIEDRLLSIIKKSDEKRAQLTSLITEAQEFKEMLENNESEINSKELKFSNKKAKIQQAINEYEKDISKIKDALSNLISTLSHRKRKFEEITKIVPLVTDAYSAIQNQVNKIDEQLFNYESQDRELKLLQSKIDNFLSQQYLMSLRETEEKLENKLNKYSVLEENYDRTYNRYNRYVSQFENIKVESKSIQSNLMSKVIKKYNDVIDRLFLQISPHAFTKHVNLISRNGNLYIILSEENKGDLLDNLSDEELYYESNASLTLSSAQANVLAICIFFALNMSQNWTKIKFLGIDDPFQNMDDINVFSFIDTLGSLQKENQIIISTHNEEFSNLVKRKSELANDKIGYIKLKSYSKEKIDYIVN
ncbi:AAA family ATPase [Priestia sp. D3YE.R1]|uniref:AAA family ATPase n=1 Tax=Priestia sp. D3YE.R1 TaxID=3400416 RepID=UPI003BA19E7D